MIILRQKLYARRDYDGLGKAGTRSLKRNRDKLAKQLKKIRKNDYNMATNLSPDRRHLEISIKPTKLNYNYGRWNRGSGKFSNTITWRAECPISEKELKRLQSSTRNGIIDELDHHVLRDAKSAAKKKAFLVDRNRNRLKKAAPWAIAAGIATSAGAVAGARALKKKKDKEGKK